ncbi:MAG: hypothetical protein NZ529_04685 [Cytophagaceae bacterium]|nr:hypothetical protein [Cytophagaceae bacterium]MDW8456072.1 hypothetical protein [Cytophagaceae bacterium]
MKYISFNLLLLLSFLVETIQAQQSIPSGGQNILSEKPFKKITPVSKKGRMEWKVIPIKNHPKFQSALQLSTILPPSDMWEQQVFWENKIRVDEGDNILFSFYGRTESTQNESTPGHVACVFEKGSPDWNKSLHHFVELSREWKQYFFPFKSIGTYLPGEAHISFQFGTTPQVIQIANIQVINYKKKISLNELPSSLRVDPDDKHDLEALTEVASKVIGPFPMNAMKIHIKSGFAEIKKVKVMNQAFNEAYQISVKVQPKIMDDVQLHAGNTLKVERGDVILVSFKARVLGNTAKPKSQVYCTFEPNTPPLNRSLFEYLPLDTTWNEFNFPFQSLETYESGYAIFGFYAGGTVQTVEIADISILNYRKNISIDKLPRTKSVKEPETNNNEKYPIGDDIIHKFMLVLYKAKGTGVVVPVQGMKEFNEAYQLSASSFANDEKDIQCSVNTELPVKAGDVMVLSFYARAPKVKASSPIYVTCSFSKATPPYDNSLNKRVTVGPTWKFYSIPFTCIQNYDAGAAKLSFSI